MHPMELIGDVGHVESHFGPFGDSVNLGARSVQDLNRMYHGHENRFGRNVWNSLVMWLMWNLVSAYLEQR